MADLKAKKISGTQARLREFIDYLDIDVKEFETATGLANGFVSKVGSSIRDATLDKIRHAYPELNTNWLLVGEGTMTGSEKSGTTAQIVPDIAYIDKLIERLETTIKEKDVELERITRYTDQLLSAKDEALILWKEKANNYEKKISAGVGELATKRQSQPHVEQARK